MENFKSRSHRLTVACLTTDTRMSWFLFLSPLVTTGGNDWHGLSKYPLVEIRLQFHSTDTLTNVGRVFSNRNQTRNGRKCCLQGHRCDGLRETTHRVWLLVIYTQIEQHFAQRLPTLDEGAGNLLGVRVKWHALKNLWRISFESKSQAPSKTAFLFQNPFWGRFSCVVCLRHYARST